MDNLSPAMTHQQATPTSGSVKTVDHRESPINSILDCLREELDTTEQSALLWTSKRPNKGWFKGMDGWTPHLLSSSALFEQIFWIRNEVWEPTPAPIQKEHQSLLNDYPKLFREKTNIDECQKWQEYKELVHHHIQRDEKETFPALLRTVPLDRALRELSYEHTGLKRGLERLPALLTAARTGELSNREREMMDLDFYHLLEHHLERENEAIHPILVFLSKG